MKTHTLLLTFFLISTFFSRAQQLPPLEKIFPVGSTWKGTHEMDGEKINRKDKASIKGKVLSVSGDDIKMEVQVSGHAVRIYELKVTGNNVTLVKNEGVGFIPGTKMPANLIAVQDSSGKLTADALSASLKLGYFATTTTADGRPVKKSRCDLSMKRN